MTARRVTIALSVLLVAPALADRAPEIVRNGDFQVGGKAWFAAWRPLHGAVRCLRAGEGEQKHLHMTLRADGDGGLTQVVELPAGRRLSLRVLATAWDIAESGVIVSLVRVADAKVLAELAVGRIVRGEVSCNFDSGRGGPAWLTVRLQGPRGGQGAVEWVTIGPPVAERPPQQAAYGTEKGDLVLRPGEGLRVALPDGDLMASARMMIREALAELMGAEPTRAAATLQVTVDRPAAADWPARESYHLEVDKSGVHIHAPTPQGALWAMMTLIDLLRPEPGGGVRILSARIDDRPELPWRVGCVEGLGGEPAILTNAVKKLARLKFNMVVVPAGVPSDGPDDWELRGHQASQVAREWGLEPVAALSSCLSPSADTMEAAVRGVIEQLRVRCLMVDLCCGPWDKGLADRLVAAARSFDPPVTLFAPFDASHPRESESRKILSQWPPEIVLVCGPEVLESATLAAALSDAARRDVCYLLEVRGDAEAKAREALAARERGEQCFGLVGWGDDLEAAANAAWRVPQ